MLPGPNALMEACLIGILRLPLPRLIVLRPTVVRSFDTYQVVAFYICKAWHFWLIFADVVGLKFVHCRS